MRLGILILLGCGCSATVPQLPMGELALRRCQLEAVAVLPTDPKQLTVADLEDAAARVQACSTPDAGVP